LDESTNFKQYGDWLHFQTSNQLVLKSRDFFQMTATVRVFALHTGSVFQWFGWMAEDFITTWHKNVF